MRDNIAKFINNAATQIAGEESDEMVLNEYGFYFNQTYWCEDMGSGYVFRENGILDFVDKNGNVLGSSNPGEISYNNGQALYETYGYVTPISFSSDGKSGNIHGVDFVLQE